MNNPNSELEARTIIEQIFPNKSIRNAYFQILSEGIYQANLYGRNNWVITCDERPRLIVRHYIVCTAIEGKVWLSLDERVYKQGSYSLEKLGWNPDDQKPGDYRNYKDRSRHEILTINGAYDLACYPDTWSEIRPLFLQAISSCIFFGQAMDKRSPSNHCPGVLMYLRNALGKHIPDPFNN